ncbi:MAG: ROK family protein [Acidobacteria bacterium]|nr:ROK family protein [Acidobacteriota bacterium]
MTEYAIGVDIGGTNLRAAAVTREGEMIDKISGTTNVAAGRDRVILDLVSNIRELLDRVGAEGFTGVGIGIPGFILLEKGMIVGSHNMPGFDNYPVRDDISQRLSSQVVLENDANAAALGESWIGAGKGVSDLVLLTLGTGIGGGIISRGKVMHGFVGMAGELGHITIMPYGNPCGCGNRGCLEKHASATAIESMANLMALGENVSARQVYELAMKGEERAKRIFESMGRALGLGLATLINIFNFPLYLLSGGVLPAWDFFAPGMFDEVNARSFTYKNTNTRIEKATLGNEAGLYGAAYLPFQAKQDK